MGERRRSACLKYVMRILVRQMRGSDNTAPAAAWVAVSDTLETFLSYCRGTAAANTMAAAEMNKPRRSRCNFDIRKGNVNVAGCDISSRRCLLLKPAWCYRPTKANEQTEEPRQQLL
jgi:hypothetical protein